MAKRRKIQNMTRMEHKHALEGAVRNQLAAMQEMKGQVFLPKLSKYKTDSQGDVYEQVVLAGKELLQERNAVPGSRCDKIISYYSRKDVQRAMYQYARGRKISVLRNFRPMFQGSGLRRPEDILPIMMFYSQEGKLWPSMHGTVSRYSRVGEYLEQKEFPEMEKLEHRGEEGKYRDGLGRTVCDLIVEVDFKKSRERSFGLARPLIKLFLDLNIEFRVKFSGNASPHIIIPAEAFPRNRCKIGSCRNTYGKLLEFFRKQIKQPKTLDCSFRNPNHFLRMPYSLNENTGMVSVPIRVEDYDRFSWKGAQPDSVIVMEDWWSVSDIPVDAPERMEELIQMALGKRKVFAVKPDRSGLGEEELMPIQTSQRHVLQMPDVLGNPVRMGMVKAGEQIAARGNALMKEPSMLDALRELHAAETENSEQASGMFYSKYGINKQDMQLLCQWSEKIDAFAYYSRPDVQEAIYSHVRDRCIMMEGMDEYLMLGEPSDIPALAAYMIGGGAAPVFRCTNARYDTDRGEMTACDVVINVDRKIASSVARLLQGGDMPSFVLCNGKEAAQFVILYEVLEASGVLKSPIGSLNTRSKHWENLSREEMEENTELSRLSDLADDIDRYLRRMLGRQNGIYVSLYEGLRLIPYSLADDGEKVNLPFGLEDVCNLSPLGSPSTRIKLWKSLSKEEEKENTGVGKIESMESFIPPDAGEKAGKFFREAIIVSKIK